MKYIVDLETGKVGEVVDILSAQFTVNIGGRIRFYFWKDKGVSWIPTNKKEDL